MKRAYGEVPWTYEEGRDPKALEKFNGFGLTLFVSRHSGKVDPTFKDLFKDTIVNDPGLKIYKTYYCAGTGDVYYFGSMEVGTIRFWQRQISKNQSLMDLEIDALPDVIRLKEISDAALANMFADISESEADRIESHEVYKAACDQYEATKQSLRSQSNYHKSILKLRSKIKHAQGKLHLKAIRFETSFKVNLDPPFKADQRMLKKGPKQLEKSWKQTASDLAHAKCRHKVIRKTGRLGNVYVPVGETCSTMECPVCGILHSPGTHYLHTCPNCRNTTIRDESARSIVKKALLNSSIALKKLREELKEKSNHLNGSNFTENNGVAHGDD